MIRAFGKAYGIRSACLRYFNAAGADRAGELGEDHTRETRLIPLALDAVTGRRLPLCLFGTDYDTEDGTAIRDYIHVEDLARAHLSALEHLLRGGQSLAVNLGTGHGASVKEVLDTIVRVTGREVPFQVADRRPGDPSVLVSEALAAADVLGWKAERSDLDTIVEDAWRWHQRRFG
jgi:UDP-glucose 4-epimerase